MYCQEIIESPLQQVTLVTASHYTLSDAMRRSPLDLSAIYDYDKLTFDLRPEDVHISAKQNHDKVGNSHQLSASFHLPASRAILIDLLLWADKKAIAVFTTADGTGYIIGNDYQPIKLRYTDDVPSADSKSPQVAVSITLNGMVGLIRKM